MTQLRDLAESKRDLLMFDPRKIQVEPGYNIRDLETADAKVKLQELARSIASEGVKQPLVVRLKGEEVFVVAGHRRRIAALIAIDELGAEIAAIPCIPEPKGTSEADRCADLVTSNSGEPLTALEIAAVVKRLIGFGWEKVQIAKRLGWETKQTVDNYLDLLAAPQDVQQMVRDNEVSPSLAMNVVRKHGDKAGETLANAKRQAASEGKSRVTTAHVKASTGEFQATAGNIKVMIGALEKIARDGDEDAADIARDALEKIGVIKTNGTGAAGHRVAAE
jgi:ParB family transcriptional regulator, chromosome partitioning protein